MKLTLAFDIYNKAEWIANLLHSWLATLSGEHEIEAILVFDACRDDSPQIAQDVLECYNVAYSFIYADDIYEIRCNNLALKRAQGDVIVFIQDDNWMHDQNWDATLLEAMDRVEYVGVVGLLAGLRLLSDFRRQRIEVDRPHHKKNPGSFRPPLGIYAVDAINRPFAVNVELLRSLGGLDEAYAPTSYDDMDLSIKLLQQGYVNLYVPFDVVNTCASEQTMGRAAIRRHYARGYGLCRRHHQAYVDGMQTTVRMLYGLREQKNGLVLCDM